MIGTTELIVIGGVILLLFGGKKIPGLMKSMGQGVKSFKQGLHDDLPEENDADDSVMNQESTDSDSGNPANEPLTNASESPREADE